MPEETRSEAAPPSVGHPPAEGADSSTDIFRPAAATTAADHPPHRSADSPTIHKCPYLAGRPPYGTYHLWPSGVNVCYARAASEQPYGHVSKETQDQLCFRAAEVYERCADHARARARDQAPPTFGGAAPRGAAEGAEVTGVRRERVRRRRRRSPVRRWLEHNGKAALTSACWLLFAAIAYWFMKHAILK